MSKLRIFQQLEKQGNKLFVATIGVTPYTTVGTYYIQDYVIIARGVYDPDTNPDLINTFQLVYSVTDTNGNAAYIFTCPGTNMALQLDTSGWSRKVNKNFLLRKGDTMEGPLIAQSNTNYTTAQVRNIIMSTQAPTATDGKNGDIWIQYSE